MSSPAVEQDRPPGGRPDAVAEGDLRPLARALLAHALHVHGVPAAAEPGRDATAGGATRPSGAGVQVRGHTSARLTRR